MKKHIVTLAALVLAFAGINAAQARTAMLVVQKDGPDMASDLLARDRLQARGFTVQIANQDADPASAARVDLVVISSTVSSKDVKPGWRQLPVPLVTWENDLLDDLAMTGKRHDVDFGETEKERYLWVVNAPEAMAANLPAGVANVYRSQAPMSWGKPGLGAKIIATIYGQPEKAAVFGYERGATMDYETLAPARRVMLFIGNGGFANLSKTGLTLFDASVDWATGMDRQ